MYQRISSLMCCTDERTVCVSTEGNVFSFGRNEKLKEPIFPPKQISSLESIKSVCTGYGHIVCLDNDGNVFTLGNNPFRQLGIGEDESTPLFTDQPQKVNLPSIQQISCNGMFTTCLSQNGDVYTFGNNTYGQIGSEGDEIACGIPFHIVSLEDINFVECGYNFILCKSNNGDVYGWGCNEYGQLGLGDFDNRRVPTKCEYWPKDIVDIKCGGAHTIVLVQSQEVYSCGDNDSAQLGRYVEPEYIFKSDDYLEYTSSSLQKIPLLSEIIRIETGDNHSMCIDTNNDIYVFGSNYEGELGLGDTDNRYEPIKHPSLSNIIDVSSGGNHSFVKTSNNEIYAFGNNQCLQLGIQTEDEFQITPIRVFEDNEDIWFSNINKSKAKSARF